MMGCELDDKCTKGPLQYKYCLRILVMDGPFTHLLSDATKQCDLPKKKMG